MNTELGIGIKDALEVFEANRSVILTIWGFYSTVTLAVLGLTVGSDKWVHSKEAKVVLQIGYIAFAIGSMCMIFSCQSDLVKVAEVLRNVVLPSNLIDLVPKPFTPPFFTLFQIVITFGVVLAINKVHRTPRRSEPQPRETVQN